MVNMQIHAGEIKNRRCVYGRKHSCGYFQIGKHVAAELRRLESKEARVVLD